jgi:hypothetical protein
LPVDVLEVAALDIPIVFGLFLLLIFAMGPEVGAAIIRFFVVVTVIVVRWAVISVSFRASGCLYLM